MNEDKLMGMVHQAVGDFSAILTGALAVFGDRLGLTGTWPTPAGRLTAAFRTGEGLGWHEHHDDLFAGTVRFFRPGYLANLTTSWIPALDGVEGKLRRGARVAEAAVLRSECGAVHFVTAA